MKYTIPPYFCNHSDSFHSNLPRIWKELHCLQEGEGRKVMVPVLLFSTFFHYFVHLCDLKYSMGSTDDSSQNFNFSLFPLVCSAWKCLTPVSLSLKSGCGHSTGTRVSGAPSCPIPEQTLKALKRWISSHQHAQIIWLLLKLKHQYLGVHLYFMVVILFVIQTRSRMESMNNKEEVKG